MRRIPVLIAALASLLIIMSNGCTSNGGGSKGRAARTAVETPTITPTITPTGPTPTGPTPTVTPTPTSTPTPPFAASALMTGGRDINRNAINSAELYDQVTNQILLTTDPTALPAGSNLNDARFSHVAVVLSSTGTGNVLIAGGLNGSANTDALNTAEIFNPATNAFVRTTDPSLMGSNMNAARSSLGGALLSTGNVLITGGLSSDGMNALMTAEIFNPTNNTFILTTAVPFSGTTMTAMRTMHTTTAIGTPTGSMVLVAGGMMTTAVITAQNTAEIFNPTTSTFTATSNMSAERFAHTATALQNGQVLITGGEEQTGTEQNTAELFNPANNKFTLTNNMKSVRAFHTATLLGNGTVLIAGGLDAKGAPLKTAEVFDPASNTFTLTTDPPLNGSMMQTARAEHAAVLLPNGKVLIAGGLDKNGFPINTAELFDPNSNLFTFTTLVDGNQEFLNAARFLLTLTPP